MFHYWRLVRSGLLFALLLAFASPQAQAEEPAAVKPWDQVTISALGEDFAKQASAAYKAIYTQGATTGNLGSGQARDYHRLRDKARVIQREARHLRSALRDGKGYDETVSVFERLMVEVRDIRVLGSRIMIQEMTREKIATVGETLRKIGDYYDPTAFDKGPAPPLGGK